MNELVETSLRSLVDDDVSYSLLKLMLDLVSEREQKTDFNQAELTESDEFKTHDKLTPFMLRFNGLCELVSNAVIADDLMGSKDHMISSQLQKFKHNLLDIEQVNDHTLRLVYKVLLNHSVNPYKKKLSLMHLDSYSTTHTLNTTSYFQQMTAYLFSVYPFGLFSYDEQVQIERTVNPAVLNRKLDSLEDGSYIKFMAYKKGWFSLNGHAMVIKKTGDRYSFFDPNFGEKHHLDQAKLCAQINNSMATYQATHMAFIDGRKYIEHVQSSGLLEDTKLKDGLGAERNDALLEDKTITQFILSEIKRIVDVEESEQMSDRQLVSFMSQLRTGIEQLMDNPGEKPTIQSKHSEQELEDRMDELDSIRLKSRQSYWGDVLKEQHNEHTVRTVWPPLIKTSYDLVALLFWLNVENGHKLLDVLQDRLPSIVHTAREVELAFTNLDDKKRDVFYSVIKANLPSMIHSARDFRNILEHLNSEQRMEIFDLKQADLASMIQSAADLNDVFEYLPEKQRVILFDDIKEQLPCIVDSPEDYVAVNYSLLPDKGVFLINFLMNKLPDFEFKSVRNFVDLIQYLSTEQKVIYLKSMLDRIPGFMKKEERICDSLAKVYSTDEFIPLFKESKKINSANFVLADLFHSDLLRSDRPKGELSNEQLKELWDGLQNDLLTYFNSSSVFNETLRGISPTNRTIIFEIMKDRLSSFVKNIRDFVEVIEVLTAEQSMMIFDEQTIHTLLASKLTKLLSNQDAKTFSMALISNDTNLIKTEFNSLMDHLLQRDCSIWSYFKREKPVSELMHELRVLISDLEPYFKDKINTALQLGLPPNQVKYYKHPLFIKLEEYMREYISTSELSPPKSPS